MKTPYSRLSFLTVALLAATWTGLAGCGAWGRCTSNEDCSQAGRICDLPSGECVWECEADDDCGSLGFSCEDHACVFECEAGTRSCPDGMTDICGQFCMDVYEASRPDATAEAQGSEGGAARSVAGVLPWYDTDAQEMNPKVAAAACEAAGKRLCSPQEWEAVCQGLDLLVYTYGDDYEASTCNGIDAWCDCEEEPYAGCYDDCGGSPQVTPTGSFPDCANDFGVYDLNGNVWEAVVTSDGYDHFRGGAYNCADSAANHACTYDATWNPSAKGFRCCADGQR